MFATDVVHNSSSPHFALTAVLPAGPDLDRPVFVLQGSGRIGSNASLSYLQCAQGTYESGVNCVVCPLGSSAGSLGSLVCTRCAAGTFTTMPPAINWYV